MPRRRKEQPGRRRELFVHEQEHEVRLNLVELLAGGDVPEERLARSDARQHDGPVFAATVFDGDGKPVLDLKQAGAIAAGSHTDFRVSGVVEKPRLWEPGHPNLYRVVCSLRVGGREVDSREIPLGIRTVRWDAGTGFYINGHHLKLHGWGQKPTDEWPGLGAALPDWMHFFTLALMKEAGGKLVGSVTVEDRLLGLSDAHMTGGTFTCKLTYEDRVFDLKIKVAGDSLEGAWESSGGRKGNVKGKRIRS